MLPSFVSAYANRRLIIIGLLGFASGLPYLLVASTLGAWLLESGIDKATIGLFAWVAIPYSFNFLWAPIIDHVRLPWLHNKLGRRRSWMLCCQLGVMVALVALGMTHPDISPEITALVAVLVAFFSASFDVVFDAYRTELLEEKQYGEGATITVFGYRMGMLMAGAGALFLAEEIPWGLVYWCMAAGTLVGVVTILVPPPTCRNSSRSEAAQLVAPPAPPLRGERRGGMHEHSEPVGVKTKKHFFKQALIDPFKDFATRYPAWLAILLFILCYRIPDGFIGFMVTPFLLDIGFAKSEVATVAKLYGFAATLVGMFIGGALIRCWGILRCLWVFMLLQMAANGSYALLANIGPDVGALTLAISLDNLSGGMVTGVAIAYMMSLVNKDYTATQYALLSSLASLSSKVLAGSAGVIAESYGWSAMFIASAAMGLPALWLWWWIVKKS